MDFIFLAKSCSLDRVVLVNFFEIFLQCFHCIISTSACDRFKVWLHLRQRGGLFADRARRLPLVAICVAWRADQVLYGSCTIGIYSDDVVLCVFLALGVEVGSRMQYSVL